MLVKIPYGRTTLSAEIGGNVEVAHSRRVSPQADTAEAVRAGLERPIETEPLSELVHRRKAETVCIGIVDEHPEELE